MKVKIIKGGGCQGITLDVDAMPRVGETVQTVPARLHNRQLFAHQQPALLLLPEAPIRQGVCGRAPACSGITPVWFDARVMG